MFRDRVALKYRIVSKVLQFPQKQRIVEKEHDFELSDSFLANSSPLTHGELDTINKEVDRVTDIIDMCDPDHDQDVLDTLTAYLEKIGNRVQHSINRKERPKQEQVIKKLKAIINDS